MDFVVNSASYLKKRTAFRKAVFDQMNRPSARKALDFQSQSMGEMRGYYRGRLDGFRFKHF
ncbi:MAG TPA: hypothetical protein DIS71_00960 [Rhodobacter sp.]|nr:hypothetical protein [Rhodobacter sp.]